MNRVLASAVLALGAVCCSPAQAGEGGDSLAVAQHSYETGDYGKAVAELRATVARDPKNGKAHILLAKSLLELQQRDAAISSAEKAVASDPRNSEFHEWLGRAYGEKADHASWLSAISLAKKTRKEFEEAVRLDERNFAAYQALVEFDCSAPSVVGGGEEKAHAEIARLAEMDAAEGHYAAGNCKRQKKDFAGADAEFTKVLQSNPKSTNLVYDIGDYAVKHDQPERLLEVANTGEKLQPSDPRGKFYRGVALVLKKIKGNEAEELLRAYLAKGVSRSDAPRPASAHVWLGKLYEDQGKKEAAVSEYRAALAMDGKNKSAEEALKRLQSS